MSVNDAVIPAVPSAPAKSVHPPRFEWYRDGFAGALAILIALVFGYAIYKSYDVLNDEDVFARAKDLVTVVAGFLGFVVGYYFQKSSADGQVAAATNTAVNAAQNEIETRADARELADAARPLLHSKMEESTRSFDPDRLRNAIARVERR